MSHRFTIPLGELRLAKYDLGNKAALLDQVALKDISNKGLMPDKFVPVRMVSRRGICAFAFVFKLSRLTLMSVAV